MKPIIEIDHLEKIYRIGSLYSYKTLRESLINFIHVKKTSKEYIKALDDICFNIMPGEKIGIIGHNGAGKSTLLKILSKITPPSRGLAILRGKVVSLLEVGTGFHGELTGRENIFFNGAILGMKRNEIKKKIDEIIAFSGIEKFIDTPVKHYSSGMQLRLAFAVAAFLEADILLVDEVLAVGDTNFQKKSMEKMNNLSKDQGKTILFVSHNMTAIKSLCNRSIVLNQGKIEYLGNTEDAISFYINKKNEKYSSINKTDIYGYCTIQSIYIKAKNKTLFEDINLNDEIEIIAELLVSEIPSKKFHITYTINNALNDPLFTVTHWSQKLYLQKGYNKLICHIPSTFLNIGTYILNVYLIANFETLIFIPSALKFTINDSKKDLGEWYGKEPGYILTSFNWTISYD